MKYRSYSSRDLETLAHDHGIDEARLLDMKAVASVLPFRTNNYVVEQLIDWNAVPRDPLFQLTFPQADMLAPDQLRAMRERIEAGQSKQEVTQAARQIQMSLNPHPSGQLEHNVPTDAGRKLDGLQHKYRETVLFFPSQGQTCHAYCSYCFRWAQFVGVPALKFASKEVDELVSYLRAHPSVSSVLLTGGDPLIMRTNVLERYIQPLLEIDSVRSVRIGTKSLAYWPYRFTTDDDAADLLRLFERVRAAGKHLAFMAHFSHPHELDTVEVRRAISRIQETGAIIRCQAPLIRHVNDNAAAWTRMSQLQERLGLIPYYMFVERDTGASRYFEVPLVDALRIYRSAFTKLSGLGRTMRGPVMSADPGKVQIHDVTEVGGQKAFVLSFLQARDPDNVGRVFFAKYDPQACWLDDLRPAHGEPRFFFEDASELETQAS